MLEVKGKFRSYAVEIAAGLTEPYMVDEKIRTLLIRRSYLKPWRMLEALVAAMNDLAKRDDAWATGVNARPIPLGTHTVRLGGKFWTLDVCSILRDASGNASADGTSLRTVDVDYDARELRVCSRFNLGFGAPDLVDAVAAICNDGIFELLEDAQSTIAGDDQGCSRRAMAEAAGAGDPAAVQSAAAVA
jgi:hypothetical protein